MSMKQTKLAYEKKDGKIYSLAPVEYIRKMYECTEDDGIVKIPEFTRDFPKEDAKEKYYAIKMNWSEADLEKVISEYNDLYRGITEISKHADKICNDSDTAKKLLSEKDYGIWYTYIRKFNIENSYEETIKTLQAEAEFEDLTHEESKILENYLDSVRVQCAERIGDNYCATVEVNRAQRLCKLLELGAPDIIVNTEAAILAQAMAIHRYGVQFDEIDQK